MLEIINRRTGARLATKAHIALTAWERTRGLLGNRRLPEGEALVLDPCNSVHMLGMRYPLYAVYLDRENRVLWEGVLRPWRFGPYVRRARKVIELPACVAGALEIGDTIGFIGEG